jgi:hypothetical protein
MQHIEAIRYEPLRGLMRASLLSSGEDAIPVTEDESCQEEFVFLARMAAAGAFIRVDAAMYFKRLHGTNAFVRWRDFPDWRRRRGWISAGVGMYKVAAELTPEELRSKLLGLVLDRMAIDRPGRGFFYLPHRRQPNYCGSVVTSQPMATWTPICLDRCNLPSLPSIDLSMRESSQAFNTSVRRLD